MSLISSALLNAHAQDRGTITGQVVDTSGAVVPTAKVTLINPSTGQNILVETNTEGTYTFLSLTAGRYEVIAEKEGFRKAQASNVIVQVSTTTRLDIQMELGAVQETVQVESTTPLLQTERSDLGTVVDNKAIQQLPLFINGGLRSNLAFTSLAPGVTMNLQNDPDTVGGAPRIAGGQANGASLLVDGGESMSERRNDPQMRVVSAEAVEEFKVQTSAYSAEFGRSSNGVLNYTTKSGTNALHGSFMAQLRHEKLNAKGFFWGPRGESVQRQHVEATNIGGPVYLPKSVFGPLGYDGRNRTFFFFAGERSRAKNYSSTGLISLPIADFRNGDFRRYTNAAGQMVPLYDPLDANGNVIANAASRQRMQCNGVLNVICPDRISPVAKEIFAHLPMPDNPSEVFNNTRERNNGTRTPGAWQGVYSIKGDHIVNDKLRVSGMFSKQYFDSYPLIGPIPGPLAEAFQEFGHIRYWRFNADYAIKPNLLNHFSVGINQRKLGEGPNLGLPDSYRAATLLPGVDGSGAEKAPNYTKYNTTEFGNYGGHVFTESPSRTINFSDHMSWVKGRHNLKFGFTYMNVSYRRIDCNNCAGSLNYSAAATGNPSVSGQNGIAYAAFLLGLPSSGNFNFGADIDYRYKYYAGYVQDDFKISSKLTINAGLRYDYSIPRREARLQNSNFNPRIPNPAAGGILGALEFASEENPVLLDTRKNAFGPRLGFAYQLTDKTVIRGGAAIMWDIIREDGNADNGIQGFGGGFSSIANNLSNGIAFTQKNGLNDFRALVEGQRPPQPNPGLGVNGTVTYKTPESGKPGYYTDFNLTVEHSFTPSTVLRASFHANYGIKIYQAGLDLNQLDPKYFGIYGSLLTSPVSSVINNPVVVAAGFKLPYASFPQTLQLQQALRPFPQYSSFGSVATQTGHSTYNGLELSFQKRYSRGLWLMTSYTFSKTLVSQNGQNIYAVITEKVVSINNRPHVFTLGYVYELPVGRGKPFGANLHPVLNAIIGNWSISAVHRYQSGVPISLADNSCTQTLAGAGTARCSYVPGQPLLNPNFNPKDPLSPYLNRAAFMQPANFTYGNVPAVIPQLYQPSQLGEDVAASKNIHFGQGEKNIIEFRASAFNVANRHLLGGLNTNFTNSNFGTFSNPQSNLPRNLQFSLRVSF
jgi:Carboxypeptidase regulatory-like domain/TonB dependent receptor-like, beta-barrel/TonB-dependent Receptor Plug Domain